MPTILIPEIRHEQRLQSGVSEFCKQWISQREAESPAPPIANVIQVHDPEWRNRLMSIQSAHDCFKPGGSPFWRAVGIVMGLSGLAWWAPFFYFQK